jgi:hypothetical protein
MLLRKEVTQASDVELLTVILGKRRTAETLLKKAGSLFTLLLATPQENGDPFCAEGSSAYAADPIMKLQAARELAARAIAEDLGGRGIACRAPGQCATCSSCGWRDCLTKSSSASNLTRSTA